MEQKLIKRNALKLQLMVTGQDKIKTDFVRSCWKKKTCVLRVIWMESFLYDAQKNN